MKGHLNSLFDSYLKLKKKIRYIITLCKKVHGQKNTPLQHLSDDLLQLLFFKVASGRNTSWPELEITGVGFY